MNFLTKIQKKKKPEVSASKPELQKVQTPIKGKRILIISDVHFPLSANEEKFLHEQYDECWILGDITSQIINALMYSAKYPVYGVLGNHDSPKGFSLKEKSLVPSKIEIQNINGKLVNAKDYTITGISGSSRYKRDESYCMLTQEQSLELFNKMEKADILISHDSAYNLHSSDLNKEGLKGITAYIEKYNPVLHLYGHHHKFHKCYIGNTLCICNYRIGIIETDGTYQAIPNNV